MNKVSAGSIVVLLSIIGVQVSLYVQFGLTKMLWIDFIGAGVMLAIIAKAPSVEN